MGFEDNNKSSNNQTIFEGTKDKFGLPILKLEYKSEFNEYLERGQGIGDKIISAEIYYDFAKNKHCLLTNSQLGCESLQRQVNRIEGKPSFENIGQKSLKQKIWNIWKKGNDIKFIKSVDIKNAILLELKQAGSSLTLRAIQADLTIMYGLAKQKAFDKLADKVADFVLKRFPAGKLGDIAIGIADKLVIAGGKRKTKLRENNEKKNKPKIRLTFNLSHIKGDSTGGGHFPGYCSKLVKHENIAMKNGVRKGDIIVNGRRYRDKGVFPDNWGLKELKEIRTKIAHERAKSVLDGKTEIKIKHRGIHIRVVIKHLKTENLRKGKKREVYKIKTLFPIEANRY